MLLATAVRFVADLEQREEAAFSDSRDHSAAVDRSLCREISGLDYIPLDADTFTNKLLQKAEEKGIDGDLETYVAVRRVKAAKRGEIYGELAPTHVNK